ncbi:MAG: hypothetical protein QW165_00240 [Candidatus Woesearchaeota archaeon]
MVKKTIIAIVLVVLLVAVFAGAASKWGYTRYGAIYYAGVPSYNYYPVYHDYPIESMYFPYGFGVYYPYMYDGYFPASYTPQMNYPLGPSSQERRFVYTPAEYPTMMAPMSAEGQLCGVINSRQYSCRYGLTCDYTKTGTTGVGICAKLPMDSTTYPYQVYGISQNFPYYG